MPHVKSDERVGMSKDFIEERSVPAEESYNESEWACKSHIEE